MNFTNNLILCIYSIMILIVIYSHALKYDDNDLLQHKLYMIMLQVTIFMLILDIFSRFDGYPGTIYTVINNFGNFMIFLFNPVLPSLWLLYVHFQVYHEEKKLRQLIKPLLVINALNVVFLIISQFSGWYYTIDSGNIYHRGTFFLVTCDHYGCSCFYGHSLCDCKSQKN